MRTAVIVSCLASAIAVPTVADPPDPHLAYGERLAQRDCGECHAVGRQGRSPNPDAPPFREIGRRIDLNDLPRALRHGMLVGHPRMPMIDLDEDEIVELTAYLKHIQTGDIL